MDKYDFSNFLKNTNLYYLDDFLKDVEEMDYEKINEFVESLFPEADLSGIDPDDVIGFIGSEWIDGLYIFDNAGEQQDFFEEKMKEIYRIDNVVEEYVDFRKMAENWIKNGDLELYKLEPRYVILLFPGWLDYWEPERMRDAILDSYL